MAMEALRRLVLSCLLAVAVMLGHGAVALAQNAESPKPPTAGALTPEQARAAIDTLQDETKRKAVIQALQAIAAAQPSEPKRDAPLSADGLGAQLILSVSNGLSALSADIVSAAGAITRAPALWYWLKTSVNDPAKYQLLFDVAWKLAVVFGGALAAEWLAFRLLRRPLAALEARIPVRARMPAAVVESVDPPSTTASAAEAPDFRRRHLNLTRIWQALVRTPFVIGRLMLELLPVMAFAGTVALLLGHNVADARVTRLAILAVVNGYVIARTVVCVVRALFGPLSLFDVREEVAVYIEIWARRIVVVAVTGLVIANLALLFGLYRSAHLALIRLVMLVVHLLVVIVILQCRQPVAAALRAPAGATGAMSSVRNWLASMWYVLAIALTLGAWAVWALNVQNGLAVLLHYFAGTLIVVLATQLVSMVLLGLIDRGFRIRPDILRRFPGLEVRANRYLPLLRRVVSAMVVVVGLVAVLEVWGIDAVVWFSSGQIGSRVLSAVVTVAIAVVVAVAIWEGANALIDRKLAVLTREGAFARAARLRTFQPMARTTLLVIVVATVALTALSEIGVNVAPLLAGAGIVGVAIGFGSQKLVQDIITGLFMLMENNVQVGDNVTLSGLSGVVENVSIRTIRLRAGDGSVHILPFSAVTTITNASRGVGNASISVAVAYKEDTDRAGQVMTDIVAQMRGEPEFKSVILRDLEVWGVDKVDGTMAVIVGQIRCTDSGRWPVQREFNRRMKIRFQQEGIEIAAPNQSVTMLLPAPASEVAHPADPDRRRPAFG